MPAASCRSMPARSISRCETISASLGFSFRIGRKNRVNRMGKCLQIRSGCAVKADRAAKHKAYGEKNPLSLRFFNHFGGFAEAEDEPAPPRFMAKRCRNHPPG